MSKGDTARIARNRSSIRSNEHQMKPITERWEPLRRPDHPLFWVVFTGANLLGVAMLVALAI